MLIVHVSTAAFIFTFPQEAPIHNFNSLKTTQHQH